jgi:hypothetical protein
MKPTITAVRSPFAVSGSMEAISAPIAPPAAPARAAVTIDTRSIPNMSRSPGSGSKPNIEFDGRHAQLQ